MKAFAFVLMMVICLGTMTRASPTQEVIDTISGILAGAFGEEGAKAKECIQEGEKIFQEIKTAVGFFEKGDVSDIIQGFYHIGVALEEFPTEFADCEAAKSIINDVEKIAEEFKNPEKLVIHVGYEILWNGRSIYADIKDSISGFSNDNFEAAGEAIGKIIKVVLIDTLTEPVADAANFIEGFFLGSLREEAKNLVTCIEDGREIINTVEKIVALAKAGVLQNAEAIFLTFIDLLSEIPKTVVMCEQAPKSMVKYLEWISKLKDVKLMTLKLFNAFKDFSADIKNDFKTMIESFKKDYKKSGHGLGDVFYILFEKVDPKSVSSLIKKLIN